MAKNVLEEAIQQRTPLKKAADPIDVANTALFLASIYPIILAVIQFTLLEEYKMNVAKNDIPKIKNFSKALRKVFWKWLILPVLQVHI